MALPLVAVYGDLPELFSSAFEKRNLPVHVFASLDPLIDHLLNTVTDLCVLAQSGLSGEEISSLRDINRDMIVVLTYDDPPAVKIPGCLHISSSEFHSESNSLLNNLLEMLQSFKNREEFAAMVLHDIRSPVNSMIAYLEMLDNGVFGELKEGQSQIIGNVMQLGDMLIELAEDLNTMNSYQQGKFELHRTQFDIGKTIDSVFLSLWAQSDQKEITLRRSIAGDISEMYGDPSKIERLLMNLVTNAIKFSPQKSVVTVSIAHSKTGIQIRVQDEGPGLDAKLIPVVFEKYFKAQSGSETDSGFGLGLFIARLIVESHGGKISVKNNSGPGCTFIIDLPAVADA